MMQVKLSIIHALAPPHFPCSVGCKYFTVSRGQRWPSRLPGWGSREPRPFLEAPDLARWQWGVGAAQSSSPGWPWLLWWGQGVSPEATLKSFSPRVLLVYPLLGWAGQAPRLTCPASALIISFLDSWPSHSEHTQPWKASETALGPCPLVSEPSQAQVTLGGKNPPSQPPCRALHARPSGPLSPVSQPLGLLPCALVVLLLHP